MGEPYGSLLLQDERDGQDESPARAGSDAPLREACTEELPKEDSPHVATKRRIPYCSYVTVSPRCVCFLFAVVVVFAVVGLVGSDSVDCLAISYVVSVDCVLKKGEKRLSRCIQLDE